uniref:VPS51 subunit of GARP complex n=1 Tax=Gorilla gorilla gorilla TaxID=9595 RepID=A0A2I2ZLC5_GORGO
MAAAAAAGPSPGSGPGDSPEGPEGEAPERRRKAHGMLKLYYGLSEGEAAGRPAGPDPLDPTDLNGAHFDPEVYLDKVPSPRISNADKHQTRLNLVTPELGHLGPHAWDS